MSKKSLSMSILIFALIRICDSSPSRAELIDSPISKSRKMVYGSYNLTSSGGELYEDPDGDRNIMISGTGFAGLFLLPGLVLGPEVSSSSSSIYTIWKIGPRLSYFIGRTQPQSSFKGVNFPFLVISFLYGNEITSGKVRREKREWLYTIKLGVGMLHMHSNTVGLTLEGNYVIDRKHEIGREDFVKGNIFNMLIGLVGFIAD